ncbi:MAG: internalization-related competence protein ComEC/Rec2 protein [Candidatus Gottesmanbacteria bacterium GW2011_GWB1_49_7]|uniref:Internalization-related competence protein ComEC/Rec2 protein n=1 Tax=Candidatus Gottesmanbacteria bacterium GW2011_GWB1_49_7 TaxID=1618448 RepID=A0A0G1YUC6_9BACT|nr:MAG: internalization-related competence protein ComEC/Rec2 protein [Candidatus Gottesmanbacteria bacterium GW2011_GWB1_49_7]
MVIITLWLGVLKTTKPPIWAENWRNFLVMRVERWLPGDEGALAAGMLWGGDNGLSRQTKESYRRVGLLHIIAASGYNVTLVAGWILSASLIWLSRRWALGMTIGGVIMYMLVAGWQPSIIRAGIMSILAMLGLILGRERDAKWLLIITGAMMLAWNWQLISDIGFQLSFAATLGILTLLNTSPLHPSPIIGEGTRGRGIFDVLVADLKTTLAAQAMTTPLILHHFGNLSVISPLVNAVLLWTVPLIMQITAVGLVIGPVNYLAWPLLKLQTWVVNSVASWPISNWEVGKMSWLWVGMYYLVLAICIKFWPWRQRVSG